MKRLCFILSILSLIDMLVVEVKCAKRVKRGSGPKNILLSPEQKIEIVKLHNDLRRIAHASNMRYMVRKKDTTVYWYIYSKYFNFKTWDSELAWLAEQYGEKCQYKHNPVRKHSTISSVGENIYATTSDVSTFTPTKAIGMWYDEIRDFDFNTRTCKPGKKCGHYTQVVWATTYKVGCALTTCDELSEINWKNAVIFICNYASAGNIVSSFDRKMIPIYDKGPFCSKCGPGDYCRTGLCANSVRDFIDEPQTPKPNPEGPSSAGLLAAVVILTILVVALIAILIYRERRRIKFKIEGLTINTTNNPARFSNQNTPAGSRLNTPRHSVVASNLHGMQKLTINDIGNPIAKIKAEDKFQSASAPTTPRKAYTKGIHTPPKVAPPPVPPAPHFR